MSNARANTRKNPKKAGSPPRGPDPAAAKRTFHRRDGAGHLDPDHAARLLQRSRENEDQATNRGFVSGSHTLDGVAKELAESAVSAMTSGEDAIMDDLAAKVTEEYGGPFVESSGAEEFASDTDESNIAGATREPFPKTRAGRAQRR
jgi:hypothetical protein